MAKLRLEKATRPGKAVAVILPAPKKGRTAAQAIGAKVGGAKRKAAKAEPPYGKPSTQSIAQPDQDLAPIGRKRRM